MLPRGTESSCPQRQWLQRSPDASIVSTSSSVLLGERDSAHAVKAFLSPQSLAEGTEAEAETRFPSMCHWAFVCSSFKVKETNLAQTVYKCG